MQSKKKNKRDAFTSMIRPGMNQTNMIQSSVNRPGINQSNMIKSSAIQSSMNEPTSSKSEKAKENKSKPGFNSVAQMEFASVSNMTPLMTACQENNIEKVREILQEDEVILFSK